MPVRDTHQTREPEPVEGPALSPVEGPAHPMLKSILIFLPLSLFLLFLLSFNREVTGPDVPATVDPHTHRPVVYNDYRESLNGETTGLDIHATDVYTYLIYLPIVMRRELNPKKGIFMTSPPCDDISMLAASWYFNCSVRPDPVCPTLDERFIPLIQSAKNMSELPEAIANAQASGWLMGFNEPDLSYQGNMTPAQAAELWPQIEAQAQAAGIKLVSPAPSQWHTNWLWDMVDEYRARYGQPPHFDAIAWHYYHKNPTAMQNFFIARRNEALARGYDVPIWVTEYAGSCGESDTGNYEIMTTITPWFDSTPWIERYAWFANRIYVTPVSPPAWQSCSLFNMTTGALNPLGVIYAGY